MLVDASEALVVYKGGGSEMVDAEMKPLNGTTRPAEIIRRVVRGPARFIPSADEWVHAFEWSGQPKDGSKTSLQPRALKFTALRTVPSSIYHNVSEVRTNDDTLITVKLMIFYELRDIEQMLDHSDDPIGDFVNAASADVIAFCAATSYETFLNETHKLNDISTFQQLCSRARHIGYVVTKVVFRGFQAGDKLQAMHDGAIQERTRLRLLEETQQQQQRAADQELHARQSRAAAESTLAASEAQQAAERSMAAHKAALAEQQIADDARIATERRTHEALLAQERARRDAEREDERLRLELHRAANAEQLAMMRAMHELGVDLTRVLVGQNETPPTSIIKLDTTVDQAGANGSSKAGKGIFGALQLNL